MLQYLKLQFSSLISLLLNHWITILIVPMHCHSSSIYGPVKIPPNTLVFEDICTLPRFSSPVRHQMHSKSDAVGDLYWRKEELWARYGRSNLARNFNLDAITGFFCMLLICDMGQAALHTLWRKAGWVCFPPKNPTALVGFAPMTRGTRGRHANHYTTKAATALPCTDIWFTLYRSSETRCLPWFILVIFPHSPTHCTVNIRCLFSPQQQIFFTRYAVERWLWTINIIKFLSLNNFLYSWPHSWNSILHTCS
jgi:hypothetical protein